MLSGIVSSIRQPMTAFRYSFRFVRPGRHRGPMHQLLVSVTNSSRGVCSSFGLAVGPDLAPLQPSYGATGSARFYPIRSGYRSKSPMNKVSVLRGYGVAVFTCGIALIIARPLNAESSCFVLAVIVSSLFGGRGPGLLAVLLSAIAFDFFFLPSPLSLSSAPSSFLRFGVFLVVALAASQLIETRRRSEEALRTNSSTPFASNAVCHCGRISRVHCP